MKACQLFILLLSYFQILGQSSSAEYEVIYNFKWVEDTAQMSYTEPEQYLLLKSNEESRFLNTNAAWNDSIKYTFRTKMGAKVNTQESVNLFMKNEAVKMKKFNSDLRLLKDFTSKTSILILYETYERHYLKEPLGLNWEMIPGVDTVAGIPCFKARTHHGGRTYMAWYTPQIPISDGPYIFHGLPGLITKVEDADKWYFFEMKAYQVKPQRDYLLPPFIEETYPMQIDRPTYITRSKASKDDPQFPSWMPNITPEEILKLREQRKSRYDLVIERK